MKVSHWGVSVLVLAGLLSGATDSRSEDGCGFFRILSSGDAEFTDFRPDGMAVWSNAVVGSTGAIQRAASLSAVGESWTDVHAFTANVEVLTAQLPLEESSSDGDYLVIDLSGGTNVASYPVSYLTAVPAGGWTDEYKTTKLVMRKITKTAPGAYTMGSPWDELGQQYDETQHQVTLTKDFYIGVFEVTQKQWERVMGNWPSWFNNTTYRDIRPVEHVTYYEIRENPLPVVDELTVGSAISPNWPQSSQVHADSFMGKLRAKTGLETLDLPTESQWEYACRAGTVTALNSGYNLTSTGSDPRMDQVGRYWYNGGSGYSQGCDPSAGTALAGSYLANAWGLYDMHGNVWEWCLDWYWTYPGTVTDPPGAASESGRVLRGGGWDYSALFCRSADRFTLLPDGRNGYRGYGVRLARTLP